MLTGILIVHTLFEHKASPENKTAASSNRAQYEELRGPVELTQPSGTAAETGCKCCTCLAASADRGDNLQAGSVSR